MAIVSSIAGFAPEPARLDRYRNELAAGLLDIRATKANTQGLLSLRKLAASAPDPDSEIVFLPQMRIINVMKACQQWITSDADIDEEVESEMTLIFCHLVPLLQNVPGAHWDLIFDVIENNLEVSRQYLYLTHRDLTIRSRQLELFTCRRFYADSLITNFEIDHLNSRSHFN